MYAALFKLESFETLPESVQCAMMGGLCESLAQINAAYLMNHKVPRLYSSGVRYKFPPQGAAQPWRDVPLLLQAGSGACGELTAWLVAELRLFSGMSRVEPLVTCKRGNIGGSPGLMFHVVAFDPQTGRTEDPSAILGMGSDEWVPFSL